ncbi:MAG: DUF4091 domain-containing protein [Bacteroidaceae bacterium]
MRNYCKTVFALALACVGQNMMAQTTQWGVPTGNPQFPKGSYVELPNPYSANSKEWEAVKGTNLSWGTTDKRYKKEEVPKIKKLITNISLEGWKGERVAAQALIWSNTDIDKMSLEMSALEGKSGKINASAAFVRYVMQDNFLTCGYRNSSANFDSTLVADPIDHLAKSLPLEAKTARPIWVSIWIPAKTSSGQYTGTLNIKSGDSTIGSLNLSVQVIDRTLPAPTQWTYHLDFWQNPFAEARYAGLVPFSDEHFAYMRPQFERLRDAGQKVITTSIMHKPWGGQTEDYFETMVTWIKKADGTWSFDYAIFDRWVEYMMEIGIDEQIACYSMIPWNMSFKYFDQTSNSMQTIKTTTDTPEYRGMWTAMLKSLSLHLKEKGWFNRTVIAMDERPTKDMQNAFNIINGADPEFKVSLAGGHHPEIENQLYDYSMASDNIFAPDTLAARHAKGQKTTFYTCCAQKYPNMFTYSPPAENEWISWFAAAKGYDGYLRWAYNSYTKEPLLDARFRAFQAGDSYLVYPEARSSIRFEKFIDGVEAFEKIHILKTEFENKGNKAALKKLNTALKSFSNSNFEKNIPAETTLLKARKILNSL